MGSRGPLPRSKAALEAAGSWRAKGRVDPPRPPKGKPKQPTWLTAKAKAHWQRLCPMLYTMGVVTHADADLLARYCATFAMWQEAHGEVKKHGAFVPVIKIILVDDGKSEPVEVGRAPNPALAQITKLGTQLAQMESKLGLNPADRARLEAHVQSDALREKSPKPAKPKKGERPAKRDFWGKG